MFDHSRRCFNRSAKKRQSHTGSDRDLIRAQVDGRSAADNMAQAMVYRRSTKNSTGNLTGTPRKNKSTRLSAFIPDMS